MLTESSVNWHQNWFARCSMWMAQFQWWCH